MNSKLRQRLINAIAPFATGPVHAMLIRTERHSNDYEFFLKDFNHVAPLSLYELRRLRDVYEELLEGE